MNIEKPHYRMQVFDIFVKIWFTWTLIFITTVIFSWALMLLKPFLKFRLKWCLASVFDTYGKLHISYCLVSNDCWAQINEINSKTIIERWCLDYLVRIHFRVPITNSLLKPSKSFGFDKTMFYITFSCYQFWLLSHCAYFSVLFLRILA